MWEAEIRRTMIPGQPEPKKKTNPKPKKTSRSQINKTLVLIPAIEKKDPKSTGEKKLGMVVHSCHPIITGMAGSTNISLGKK
jgi:hypothetical protein